jgi:hypothetical protein
MHIVGPPEEERWIMEEKIAPPVESDIPSWLRIFIPHGLDVFVPKGCVTWFMGLPWWLDILYTLGIAPILVWPKVLEQAGPRGLAGIVLSDIVCIYPLLIPVCIVASMILFKRNHRTVAVFFAALNLTVGLTVVGAYMSGAMAK